MADSSPTIRQRELGLRLRKLRNALGLTVEDVADKLLCSTAKISRMETGARRPSLRDVRDLCGLYDVDESLAAELMKLTREAREQGRWTQYEDLKLSPYVGLEQDASSITAYCMYFLHGLVQTEDYARAIIEAIAPRMEPAGHEPAADEPVWHRQCENGACMEVAVQGEAVMLRTSIAPEATITLSRAEWREFIAGAKQGLFDGL